MIVNTVFEEVEEDMDCCPYCGLNPFGIPRYSAVNCVFQKF